MSSQYRQLNRRDFLKVLGGAVGAASAASIPVVSMWGQEDRLVRPLEMISWTRSERRMTHDALRLITERLEDLGFQMKFNPMAREAQLDQVWHEHNYDMTSLGYTGRVHRLDPYELLTKSYHSDYITKANYNWTHFSCPDLDELLDKAASEMVQEERKKLVYKAQEQICEIVGGEVPFVHPHLFFTYNNRKFEGFVKMAGIGLKNIWTFTEVEPRTNDKDLTCAFPFEATHLTPWLLETPNLITMRGVYDKLIRLGPDGLPRPWLAEEWKLVSDTQIDFKIRKGHKFHDGVSVTPEDVKFTYDYIKEWEIPVFEATATKIEKVEILPDNVIRFTLTEPFAPIFTLSFARVFIVPKHIWKDIPEKTKAKTPWLYSPVKDENLIGSGPLKFVHWRKGTEIKQTAYKEHWKAPKYENRLLRPIPSASAMLGALMREKIDYVIEYGGEPEVLQDLAKRNDNFTFGTTISIGYDELSMHTGKLPFADRAVRQAIAAAIPAETIATEVYKGFGTPASSPVSPTLEYWHNPNVEKWYKLGLDGARKILKDAGYEWDPKGRLLYPVEGPKIDPCSGYAKEEE